MNSRWKYLIVSASTCLTILFLVGSVLGQSASTQEDTLKHIGVFSEVVARIQSEYVEEPDMRSVSLGALDGMLEAIDPFASYLNADQYRDYLKNKDVKQAGVGLILCKRPGYVSVVAAIPGSPAAKAGFSTGDMIESIKSIATRDMPLAYANLLLEGQPGSEIDVSVVHVRQVEPQTAKLIRADITLPAVDSSLLADNVGYINVDALGPDQVKQVGAAIQSLQKNGARKLVLDLRDCAAGTPEDGIALANLFMDKGHITYLQGQRVPRQDFDADPSKALTNEPMAVLTDRGTASGAEIAAAAFQDSKRAQLFGEPTYGDASMLKAINMEDGGAIILSVAKYYSPNGQAIQDTRVTPSVLVSEPEPQIDYDENGEPLPPANPQSDMLRKSTSDPVVKKALETL
ncbi:MAG TPA: S41 family peptidase, partial [Bryobacteraceae bacterium]|nr:S41 family peptidase [Bryobacteraceae bacterium]